VVFYPSILRYLNLTFSGKRRARGPWQQASTEHRRRGQTLVRDGERRLAPLDVSRSLKSVDGRGASNRDGGISVDQASAGACRGTGRLSVGDLDTKASLGIYY
jgi:hypothetical protein